MHKTELCQELCIQQTRISVFHKSGSIIARIKSEFGVKFGPFAQNPRGRLFADFIPASLKKVVCNESTGTKRNCWKVEGSWMMNPGTPQTLPPGELPRGGSSTEELLLFSHWFTTLQAVQLEAGCANKSTWATSQPSSRGCPPSKDLSPSLARLQLSTPCPRTKHRYRFSCTVKVIQYKKHVFILVLKPNDN